MVYIGNPVHNPRIRAMYLRQVTKNRYVADSGLSRNTRIRIEQTDFDLGKLKQGNAATVSVFCNTDISPLIIRLKGTVEQ
ncbi:MAG: hypothetical protein PHC64_10255 [Candidatus Gastranaerophilales bacterium]|nr:hypothetical protein [Candidatus Gastranaerophilales bacterium]